jgi:hypothetical protein
MNRSIVVALVCGAALGCQRTASDTSPKLVAGQERGACRTDQTCDPGLWCLSDLCVRPPQANCTAVAATLTSFELGNYAEPEDRAPIEAKYAQACRAAFVTKEEGACLTATHDAWSARACAPRMFPPEKPGACTSVLNKVRTLVSQQMPNADDPAARKVLETSMQVMQASCEEDHWPDDFKSCVLASETTAQALEVCNRRMPASLQQRLQERMTKAMTAIPPQ